MFKDDREGDNHKSGPKQRQMCRLDPKYAFFLLCIFYVLTNIYYSIWVLFLFKDDGEGDDDKNGRQMCCKDPTRHAFLFFLCIFNVLTNIFYSI